MIEAYIIIRSKFMGIARCLGIGIVMIIPSFVGGGALWVLFKSWAAVSVWIIIMAIVYGIILSKVHCTAD
jgi:hypothetical protein